MGCAKVGPPEELLEEIDELVVAAPGSSSSADQLDGESSASSHEQHAAAPGRACGEPAVPGPAARTNVSAASALLKELRRDVHDAVDSLRELAHRVYRALLWIEVCRTRSRAAVLALEVPARLETDGLERHAPELEATVYFSCLDALNAVADAGATRVAIRVLTLTTRSSSRWKRPGPTAIACKRGEPFISTRDGSAPSVGG